MRLNVGPFLDFDNLFYFLSCFLSFLSFFLYFSFFLPYFLFFFLSFFLSVFLSFPSSSSSSSQVPKAVEVNCMSEDAQLQVVPRYIKYDKTPQIYINDFYSKWEKVTLIYISQLSWLNAIFTSSLVMPLPKHAFSSHTRMKYFMSLILKCIFLSSLHRPRLFKVEDLNVYLI